MSRPVSTSSTELRKPPSSLTQTLSCSGGASPRTPEMPTRSGPSSDELDRVEVGGDVGAEVAGRLHLVHQLRGDGVDADQPAGAGVLGDHRRAVLGQLGEREPQRLADLSAIERKPEKLPPVAWVPHSRTCPATTAPASASYAVGLPAEVRDGRADDQRRVGDPAGDHDVRARGAAPRRCRSRRGRRWPSGRRGTRATRTSSPSTYAIEGDSPSPVATSPRRVGQAGGVEAAGVATIFTPRSRARPRQSSTWRTNVRA